MAAASAIGLTLTAAVGAIAANTGLLGTASSAGRVGQLSPISVPGTSANTVPSSTPATVDVEPLAQSVLAEAFRKDGTRITENLDFGD